MSEKNCRILEIKENIFADNNKNQVEEWKKQQGGSYGQRVE